MQILGLNLKRNERKIIVLAILTQSELTAREILKKMNNSTSIGSLCTLLKRYQDWALLNRKNKNGVYFYNLTEKGKKKLDYLKNEMI